MNSPPSEPVPPITREPLLRTRRLVLRALDYVDAPALLRLDRDERVHGLLLDEHVRNLAQAAHLVAWMHQVYRRHPGLGNWHVRDERDRFVGLLSLMPVADGDDVEIGARFMPDSWGRFYALEGGRGLVDYAFGRLGLPRLVGFCHPQNRAPALVLRRLGFEADGETRHFDRPALRFRLDRAHWEQRRRNRPIAPQDQLRQLAVEKPQVVG